MAATVTHESTGNDDLLVGSANRDTVDVFVFEQWNGDDTISKFQPGKDIIDLSGFTDRIAWEDLSKHISVVTDPDSGNVTGVKIDLSEWGNGTIFIQGLQSADALTESSFRFPEDQTIVATSAGLWTGAGGDDEITGSARGDDTIYGFGGDDVIEGRYGDDRLYGGAGDDTIDGGEGDDTIHGGEGSDVFAFSGGHGDDEILDFDTAKDSIDLSGFAGQTILWADLRSSISTVADPDNPDKVTGVRIDLTDWGGGTITLQGVASASALGESMFKLPAPVTADQTITGDADDNRLFGGYGDDTIEGGAGHDRIVGRTGDDTIDGGAGDDLLWGGAGADVFAFGAGDGRDAIVDFETGKDIIDLSGFDRTISWAELSGKISAAAGKDGATLGVEIDLSDWGGGTITLMNVDSVSSLTESHFRLPVVTTPATPANVQQFGDGDDSITVGHDTPTGIDTVDGGGGDDTIFSLGGGVTVLRGGAGNDTISGSMGSETIDGGAGDDRLSGDNAFLSLFAAGGADSFVFAQGHGDDTITDFAPGTDIIDLTGFTGETIAWEDLSGKFEAVTDKYGSHVRIDLSDWGGGTITLEGVSASQLAASSFKLPVVTTDQTLSGDADDNAIYGGAGSDIIDGKGGDDTISAGAGDDRIHGGAGDDTLKGGAGSDVFAFEAGDGDDTIADFAPGTDIIDLSGLAAGGFTWSELSGKIETVTDADGTRTVIDLSDWDGGTITLEGVSAGQLTAGSFKLPAVEDLSLVGTEGGDTLRGGAGDDTLYGGAGDDALTGGAGDDLFFGGAGDDTLTGGAGSDVFAFKRGGGDDTVTDFTPGTDIIDLSWLDQTLDWNHLSGKIGTVTDADGTRTVIDLSDWRGGTITLEGVSASQLTESSFRLPNTAVFQWDDYDNYAEIGVTTDPDVVNADGGGGDDIFYGGGKDNKLFGGEGSDWLFGGEGEDVLEGGAGDDTLHGGADADTFVYGPRGGADTIADFVDGEDVIDLSGFSGIAAFSDLDMKYVAEGGGGGVVINFGGGDTLTLTGATLSELSADDFIFAEDTSADPPTDGL